MREIERYFIIDEFEDGWGIDEFFHEELLYDYCAEVLFIPYEKIEDLNMKSFGLEIMLDELEFEDVMEDWYVNLSKKSIDISSARYIA